LLNLVFVHQFLKMGFLDTLKGSARLPFSSFLAAARSGAPACEHLRTRRRAAIFSVRRPAFFAAEGPSRRLPLMMAFGPHFRFE